MSWDDLFTGLGPAPAKPAPAKRLETDDELRARLLYVGGDGPAAAQRIMRASGAELDYLAESLNLKRRMVS